MNPLTSWTTWNNFTKDEVLSIEDIKFGVKKQSKGKSKDIKGYQDEILKIGGPILIPHIHISSSI
jgi:hypothetical protein